MKTREIQPAASQASGGTQELSHTIDSRLVVCEAQIRDNQKAHDMIIQLYDKEIADLKKKVDRLDTYVHDMELDLDYWTKDMNRSRQFWQAMRVLGMCISVTFGIWLLMLMGR